MIGDRADKKEGWMKLFQAAKAFKDAKCWEWMYDSDVFGVKDPESGQVAYCCIMGNEGLHFGIAAYIGDEGLRVMTDMFTGRIDYEEEDLYYMQKSLLCSFEDRQRLTREDLDLIKDLGLRFRGRNQWPVFRQTEPGMYPWFINEEQSKFLTHILEQSLIVALRCKEDKSILEYDGSFTFLVREPTQVNGNIDWEDRYLTPEIKPKSYTSFLFSDEILIKRLLQAAEKRDFIMEAGIFYLPMPVAEGDRPFFPKVCVLLDHNSGLSYCFEMIRDIESEGNKCIEMLAKQIEKTGIRPSRLLTSTDEAYYTYLEACKQLSIDIKKVKTLKHVEGFKSELIRYHRGID